MKQINLKIIDGGKDKPGNIIINPNIENPVIGCVLAPFREDGEHVLELHRLRMIVSNWEFHHAIFLGDPSVIWIEHLPNDENIFEIRGTGPHDYAQVLSGADGKYHIKEGEGFDLSYIEWLINHYDQYDDEQLIAGAYL